MYGQNRLQRHRTTDNRLEAAAPIMAGNITNLTTSENEGAWIAAGFLTIIPGVLGNTAAIAIFSKASRKTKHPVNCLLLALAMTDLFGCFLASYTAASVYTGYIQNRIACNTVMFVVSVGPMSTASVTCLLALDRYFALCHPFTYSKYASQRKAYVAVCVSLGISAFIALLPVFKLGNYYMETTDENGDLFIICSGLRFQHVPHERVYGVAHGIVGMLIILTVIVANFLVIRTVLSLRRTVVIPQCCDTGSIGAELKFARMVAGVSLVLFFCWTPFMMLMILVHVGYELSVSRFSPIMIVASLNFIVDPFVHVALRRSYRQAVWRNVCCCRCFRQDDLTVTSSTDS